MSNLVYIYQGVIDELIEEAGSKLPHETGGSLFGYEDINQVKGPILTIDNICGPGPNASHEVSSFEPDYDFCNAEIDRIFTECSRMYFGDWHTHPGGNGFLSDLDQMAIMRIFGGITPKYERIYSLILWNQGNGWEPWVWFYDGRSFKRINEVIVLDGDKKTKTS